MKLLNVYNNGNYKVLLFDDGTKIRKTNEDKFISSFPECIDLKITNQCDMGCKYCHEDSTIDGLHGDILNSEFINTLKPYTELALGGGNVLTHPNLVEFLQVLKSKNIIANITVNQKHFIDSKDTIRYLVDNDLIKGLGVSLIAPTDEFIGLIKQFPNAVIHVINGIVILDDLQKLYNNNLKLLILGYKVFRRGKDFYSSIVEQNKQITKNNIQEILKRFKVVSFDNLAIKQLDMENQMSKEHWEEFYMGDDGQFTMYIDLVKRQFARSSISTQRYDLLDNIEDMFNIVKNEER
jgi:organic radical activating enzyme